MTTVRSYKTPQEFLDNTEKILELRELENNLILGLCNGFADKSKVYEGCVFINAFADNQIQASSIKTVSKAIVSGTTKDIRHIKSLADYYTDNAIHLTGAVGESFYSFEFSNFYGKRQVGEKTMIVHKLTSVNSVPLAPGNLVTATSDDINLIMDWTIKFEEDAQVFPKQSREQILKSTQTRVGLGNIFKWIHNDEIVSIAAIVRKTKNAGIVGLVYTPDNLRGRGYATSCVQKLSELILSYMKSGRLAVNVLIDLYNLNLEPKATFDFVDKTIVPAEARTQESGELLKDYLNWLPDHFTQHKCDLTKLGILEITIWTDFDNARTPPGMSNSKEFIVSTLTKWKADGRDEQTIEISQTEIIKENFVKLRIPEFK